MRAFSVVALYIIVVRSLVFPASLVLEMDKDVYRVGELGIVTLRIEGATLTPAPTGQPGFTSPAEVIAFSTVPVDTGFTYRMRWRAPEAGEHTVGPFTVTIDGKEYKSGSTQVLVRSDKISGTEVSFDRRKVTVGTSFHLEIQTTERKLNGIWLKVPALVTANPVSTTSATTISAGKRTSLNIYKFPLKAVKAGTLVIGPEDIQGIDPKLQFTPVTIEITGEEND